MKKIYATYAENRAARNARQNAKRAQLMSVGLTTKGTPRRRYVRGAAIHFTTKHHIQAPSVPTQSVEDYIARGGYVEMLPGPRYTLPPQTPLGAPEAAWRY